MYDQHYLHYFDDASIAECVAEAKENGFTARALAETDIFAAAMKCAELTNRYVESQGRRAHPRTLSMLRSGIRNKEE